MRFFPVFLDLSAGTVVLVGDGEPARSKLRLLRSAGARVRWHVENGAPAPATRDPAVAVSRFSCAQDIDLSDAIAVVAAAGEPTDTQVAALARARRLPVNVVDRPELSTFIVPAIIDRGDVVVAVGTGGTAPVLARWLRAHIEALLPARIGALSALMGRYRERLAAVLTSTAARRRFWERVIDGPIAAAALAGRVLEAEAALLRAIAIGRHGEPERGAVFLVGAGPGDADLITLRALHVLQAADVVFHDAGVNAAVLDRARRDAQRIEATGDDLGPALARQARRGRQVVRLVAGDPMAGRIEGEAAWLRAAGVQVVVVPGVSGACDAASTDTLEAA